MPSDAAFEPQRPRRPRRAGLVAVVAATAAVLVLLAVLAARGLEVGPFQPGAQERNVFAERPQYADPGSRAAQAAAQARADGRTAEAEAFAELASVPAGIWLTPEEHPPGEVGGYVAEVVESADEAGRVPVLVVYGVPDRDCTGGFSAGGLDAEAYLPWVREVATAAGGADRAVVVLEPDALAAAVECDRREERVALLSQAVDVLVEAGVTTYLDGGHSGWVPARELAELLRQVGVDEVRGFATNVANYQTDAAEVAWAERLSRLTGGASYVVDSGRNGVGSPEDWCNPPGQALGQRPGYVDDGTRLDAYLWIKPPGESDGECNGGPPAGQFWPERASQLVTAG
ncbi:glycoside hydrolase family 6 protein [Nocardioides sp. SYSU DS0663]|uniref:glycoside hydrolase family 6 protein n=1 Tax=Nocardioides sp. SYSU DS0663 TaxID=3416445 RepID=UPI003F4B248E